MGKGHARRVEDRAAVERNWPFSRAENLPGWKADRPRTGSSRGRTNGSSRLARWGLTQEDYDALLSRQDGRCALCGEPFGDKLPFIDHDHATRRLRSLLHPWCNTGLGFIEKFPGFGRLAEEYLAKHR